MIALQLAGSLVAIMAAGETVLLDFHADWCGPCRMMQPVVNQLEAEGYPIRKVNIDKEPQLAQKFGVQSVPSFILLVDGQPQGRTVGATTLKQLKQMLSQAGVSAPGEQVVEVRGQSPDRRPRLLERLAEVVKPKSNSPLVDLSPSQPPLSVDKNNMLTAANERTTPPANPLVDRLLQASVRLRINESHGVSFGSGTIIEYRPAGGSTGAVALVLTCGHIFRQPQDRGTIWVDLFDHAEPQSYPARLVRYDLARDIGLVEFDIDRPVVAVKLAPDDLKIAKGEDVISIGCDRGSEPTAQENPVLAVNGFIGPPNLQVDGQPAVGRSGGGLFNQNGQLIGVCNFADPTEQAGLYAAVELARDVFDQADWSPAIRRKRTDRLAANPSKSASAPTAPIGFRRDPPRHNTAATRRLQSVPPTNVSDAAEIICIVRNRDSDTGRNQVILIPNPSPQFLERLAAEGQVQQPKIPTSMNVAHDRRNVPSADPSGSEWVPEWR